MDHAVVRLLLITADARVAACPFLPDFAALAEERAAAQASLESKKARLVAEAQEARRTLDGALALADAEYDAARRTHVDFETHPSPATRMAVRRQPTLCL